MQNLMRFIGLLSIVSILGCSASNPTVATIGTDKYTLKEFEYDYAKNNGSLDESTKSTLEDRKKFVDLMINFKLKVKEAYNHGLQNDSSLRNEIEGYRSSVTQSYILEKELVDPAVRQIYKRRLETLRASHILVRIPSTATSADTVVPYKRAMEIIAQVPKVPFDSLALKTSEDPSAQRNKGDLGYFTGGKMVGSFEDICYTLKVGEYTKIPVRTRFGYHIVKLTDRRQNEGTVTLAHILLLFSPSMSDTAHIRDSIWTLYRTINAGYPFDSVAAKYSMDRNSAKNHGIAGDFSQDRLPDFLADRLFHMTPGTMTEPIRFNYGFHIFKVLSRNPIPPFEALSKELRDAYQTSRYQEDYQKFCDNLIKRFGIELDQSVTGEFSKALDTTKTPANVNWSDTLKTDLLKKIIIKSTVHPYTVKNIVDKINANTEFHDYTFVKDNIQKMLDKFVQTAGLELYAFDRIKDYPELEKLLKEYEEGILLYRIEQDEVWNKIVSNDSVLHIYYDQHKENYRWPERVNFAEIYVLKDSLAKAVYKKIKKGADFLKLAEQTTVRLGYKEKRGIWGFQPFGQNTLAEYASLMKIDSITPPFVFEGGWSMIKALGRDSAHVKSFEEAKPEIIGSYQDYAAEKRKEEWINELRAKNPIVINMEVLGEAFKKR